MISVIGLGYVGLPVAVAFAGKMPVIGFDVDASRIRELKAGRDANEQVSAKELKRSKLHFSSNPKELAKADFHIVTVPTPLTGQRPDLSHLMAASKTVGTVLKKGDIVVYESTVYPGVTEEVCAPILERASGLRLNIDFFVGYSPERINAGDPKHRFETIHKVVSASTPQALSKVAAMYAKVVKGGIHKASSIRVAEAAKVIENTQRDLNIALVNEYAQLFDRLGLDTQEVLAAAKTKWNFLPFTPGLVGGHCIGVDSYYLAHKAEEAGYHPQVILAGRRINEGMGAFVAGRAMEELERKGGRTGGKLATVLGISFKENCKDIRNSKVVDVVRALEARGMEVQVHDPIADAKAVQEEYGITLTPWNKLKPAGIVVIAVAHEQFRKRAASAYYKLLADSSVVADVKALFSAKQFRRDGITYWRL